MNTNAQTVFKKNMVHGGVLQLKIFTLISLKQNKD